MRRLMYLLIASVVVIQSIAMSPAPQILEPVNWEADADTRFNPRVEQVVIALRQYTKPTPADPWKSWDLNAMDRLQTLMDDARWKDFSQTALQLFYQCPLAGSRAIQAAELQRRADAATLDSNNAYGLFLNHMSYAANNSPDLIRPFLEHPNGKIRAAVAGRLISCAREIPDEVAPVIDRLATSENPEERQSAAALLCQIPSKVNSDRALALAATVSNEAVKQIEDTLRYMRAEQERKDGMVRAKEPMALILNKEKKQ